MNLTRLIGFDVVLTGALGIASPPGDDADLYPHLSAALDPALRLGSQKGPFVRFSVAPSLRLGEGASVTLGPAARLDVRVQEALGRGAWSLFAEGEIHQVPRFSVGIGVGF